MILSIHIYIYIRHSDWHNVLLHDMQAGFILDPATRRSRCSRPKTTTPWIWMQRTGPRADLGIQHGGFLKTMGKQWENGSFMGFMVYIWCIYG